MINQVFYNQQRSGYDEMLAYGPYFYKDILEMDANYKFAGYTLDIMAEGLEKLMKDQFINSFDEENVVRLERWLGIETDSTRSLDDRKKKIQLVWNGGDKLCGRLIKNLVRSYTGVDETPEVTMTTFLRIQAQAKEENVIYLGDLLEQIERMKPAHIRMEFDVVYATKMRFKTNISHYLFYYDKTGEKPEIATIGSYDKTIVSTESITKSYVFEHRESAETMEAGTFPNIGTIGDFKQSIYRASTDETDTVYSFMKTSEEQESGIYPNVTTVGAAFSNSVTVETAENVVEHSYIECGSKSCGEEVL